MPAYFYDIVLLKTEKKNKKGVDVNGIQTQEGQVTFEMLAPELGRESQPGDGHPAT